MKLTAAFPKKDLGGKCSGNNLRVQEFGFSWLSRLPVLNLRACSWLTPSSSFFCWMMIGMDAGDGVFQSAKLNSR